MCLTAKTVALCPSVPKPERFPSFDKGSRTKLPPSVDFPFAVENRFPECHPQAVRGAERFRGGCASRASPPPHA